MDPLTLAAIAGVLLVALVVGMLAAWWIVRTTVKLVKRLIVLALVLMVGTGLLVGAIVAFSMGG